MIYHRRTGAGNLRSWRAGAGVLASTALGASLSALVATDAIAQSTGAASATEPVSARLAEVLVTAERRKSTAQKTAASVTVKNGEDLRRNGQYTLQQILESVPGVVATGGSGGGFGGSDTSGGGIIIRGVSGATATGNTSAVPTTAVYADGVYEGIGGSYDIGRVEILRGPQGTLYGRSATSGVVATYTRDPVLGKLGGDESVEIGNYGLLHYNGALNLPLIGDTLALRVAANHFQRDGYISASGGKQSSDDWRVKLLYQPGADFSALFAASEEFNTTNSGGTNVQLISADSKFSYSPLPIATQHNNYHQYWANFNWNFGPATLTYLPAYRKWHQNAESITSGSSSAVSVTQTPYDQFITQELRLASTVTQPLSWQTGLFFYDNKVKATNSNTWLLAGAIINKSAETKLTQDGGVFGEATYSITPRIRFTGGLRYDYTQVKHAEDYSTNSSDDSSYNRSLTSPAGALIDITTYRLTYARGTRQWRNITFKARGEYDLTASNLLYASISSGYLPGDVGVTTVSSGSTTLVNALEFKEETLTAYEIGSKNRFLNNRLQVNADVYYYDYGGYQTTLSDSNFDMQVVTVPLQLKGGELETTYRLTPADTLGLSAGYIYGNFVEIPPIYSSTYAQTVLYGIPPLSIDPSYSHDFSLADGAKIGIHADAEVTSPYNETGYSAEVEKLGLSKYSHLGWQIIGNASANWTSASGRYSLDFFVRNLGNNHDKVRASATVVQLPAIFGGGIINILNGTPHDPRTIGVSEHITF